MVNSTRKCLTYTRQKTRQLTGVLTSSLRGFETVHSCQAHLSAYKSNVLVLHSIPDRRKYSPRSSTKLKIRPQACCWVKQLPWRKKRINCSESPITEMLSIVSAVLLIAAVSCAPFESKVKEQCVNSSDCLQTECCVTSREDQKVRVCAKKPGHGDFCSPLLFPGVDHSCPCLSGLTCAQPLEAVTYHCVPVPEMEDEQSEWE